MKCIRSAALPGLARKPELEPRGAIWVSVEFEGKEIQLINTHLGLRGAERAAQVEALLGPEWLGHPNCRERAIVCGDFNAVPGMEAYRLLNNSHLRDAQRSLNGHRPKGTWFGRVPLSRLDHVFVTKDVPVVGVDVVRTNLARFASDHLPLIVDVRVD